MLILVNLNTAAGRGMHFLHAHWTGRMMVVSSLSAGFPVLDTLFMQYNYRKVGYGDWRNAWMMTEINALLLKNVDEFQWVGLGNLQLLQSSFELAHFECKFTHLRTVSNLFKIFLSLCVWW